MPLLVTGGGSLHKLPTSSCPGSRRGQLGSSGRAGRPHWRPPAAVASGSSDASKLRSVVVLPGLGNNTADYARLAAALQARQLNVEVAQVSRLDW